MKTTTTTVNPHQATIDGLLDLAAFLADHPDLPVDPIEARYCVFATPAAVDPDVDGLARLSRIAKELGREVTGTLDRQVDPDATHFYASRSFGSVTYRASYIRRRAMADHIALMSYSGAVQPGDRS